jgi:polyisoprenoid-binding protein YceI
MTQLQTEDGALVRVPVGTWAVDPSHSSVAFEVKHMKIATVRGQFREFEGMLEAAEDPTQSRARGAVRTGSIDTGNEDRDNHLRSPDFFDSEHFPEAIYESTRVEPLGGPDYRVWGNLTIKDVTREVEAIATVEGAGEDPWGNERVGVSIRTEINRTEFGLRWQQRLASGGLLVGEEVKLIIDASLVKQS